MNFKIPDRLSRWFKTLFAGVLIFACCGLCGTSRGAGVTIITHGFEGASISHTNGWLEAMGNSIADKAGGTPYIYKLVIKGSYTYGAYVDSFTYDNQNVPNPGLLHLNSYNSEVIIKVYWDDAAGLIPPVGTGKIAQLITDTLVNPPAADYITARLSEMPVHLIGHSRGGSVVCETAKLLGQQGIWVDQVTTLDPRPFPVLDADVAIYENVLYADNYYEKTSATVHGFAIYPGASNRNLNGYLIGGYGDTGFSDHSDVHLWYHGTINTDQYASNGEQTFTDDMRANWYEANENHGAAAGYYYSRINGHLRNGFLSGYFNGNAFTALNQTPQNRTALDRSKSNQWPNIIQINRTSSNSVQPGGAINGFEFVYQSYNQGATITSYLSDDNVQNPYDSAGIQIASTAVSATQRGTPTKPLSGSIPSTVTPGTYNLYAKITAANGATRYTYYPGKVFISASSATTPGPQPPTNLRRNVISSSEISLSWNDTANETGFVLQRKTGISGTYANLPISIGKGVLATFERGLTANTTYYYRVIAKGSPDSSPSSEVVATTQGVATPASLRVLQVNSNNPGSGVRVFLGQTDNNGNGDGDTPFSRQFTNTITVTLVASASSGGNSFLKWQKDGADFSTNANASVLMDASHTMTALYSTPAQTGSTYTIRVTAFPDVGGAVTGNNTYAANASATIQATAAPGYTFLNWTKNVSGQAGGTTFAVSPQVPFTVTSSLALVANFTQDANNNYTVSTTAQPLGGGNATGAGSYSPSSNVNLSAQPASGYVFDYWTENGVVISYIQSYQYPQLSKSHDFVAHFHVPAPGSVPNLVPKFNSYTRYAFAGGAGNANAAIMNRGNLRSNTFTTYLRIGDSNSVVPPEFNYDFYAPGGWGQIPIGVEGGLSAGLSYPNGLSPGDYYLWLVVDPEGVDGEPAANRGDNNIAVPLTILPTPPVNGADLVPHDFTVTPAIAFPSGTLDVKGAVRNAGNAASSGFNYYVSISTSATVPPDKNALGVVGTVPGLGIYVDAGADSGFSLPGNIVPGNYYLWIMVDPENASGEPSGNQANNNIVLPLTVAQPLQTYTVTANTSPGNGGTANGGGTYSSGALVPLAASPATGYGFLNWSENGNILSSNANYSFTATGGRAVIANFVISYAVTPSAGANGSINPNMVQTVNSGGSTAFSAIPNGGYVVDQWLVNSAVVQTGGNSYTASNVTANATVQVTFMVQIFTIATSSSPVASGGTSGGGTVSSGSSVTVVATPNAGYNFVNWTEGGNPVSGSASYNFTASASRMLVANFTPTTYSITTSFSPVAGGSTSGGGTFNPGTGVTVLATPNGSYDFVKWTEGGNQVSASASYNFTASADRNLVANFALSSNASLASLVPSTGTMAPVFASGTTSYTATVGLSSITVTPIVARTGATVKVNGTVVPSSTASGPIALTVGVNPAIAIIVTAPDGVTTQSYMLTVTRRSGLRDLNNDGNADLLFQNNLGQIAAWYMNGAGVTTSSVYFSTSALGDWKVKGVADMNGDGNADIIFQNNVGQIAVWYLNGSGVTTSTAFLYSSGLGDWRVVGVADMNGDGNADLLFQNNIGQIAVWYLNGSGITTSSAFLYNGGLGDWRVVGVADMNGDGNADLLFQNTIGQVGVWYLNGGGVTTSTASIYSGALGDWRVVSVADMNGDGILDILFQNNAGQISAWYRDGSGAITSSVYLYIGGLGDWRVR